jgi:arylsulfatase
MNWPSNSSQARLLHKPAHIVDIAATIYDVTGAAYPNELHGNSITPLEGESFLGVFDGDEFARQAPICWEHEGNRAVRMGDWKLVSEGNTRWELYNMVHDRTELNDLSESESDRVAEMTAVYEEWAARTGALPWPVGTGGMASPRVGTMHIHDVD